MAEEGVPVAEAAVAAMWEGLVVAKASGVVATAAPAASMAARMEADIQVATQVTPAVAYWFRQRHDSWLPQELGQLMQGMMRTQRTLCQTSKDASWVAAGSRAQGMHSQVAQSRAARRGLLLRRIAVHVLVVQTNNNTTQQAFNGLCPCMQNS